MFTSSKLALNTLFMAKQAVWGPANGREPERTAAHKTDSVLAQLNDL